MATKPQKVLVVGGGAAGVITAATLLRDAAGRPDGAGVAVTVVERSEVSGPGLAYGTSDPLLLLNNYAGRMSAFEDDADHLVRWCRGQGLDVAPETFLQREAYGRYLAALLGSAPLPAGSSLTRIRDEVVDLTEAGSTYVATLRSGVFLTTDAVVLALGNPPPRRPHGLDVEPGRFVVDPWAPGLLDRVGEDDRVLLVGTGLTTVDVAAQISSARPRVRLTATSRHGLLPMRHLPEPPGPAPALGDGDRSLGDALAAFRRRRAEGGDWRCLVESVKAVANDLWRGLSLVEREQFVRHVGRHWEIARHRMAPPMAAIVDDLLTTGRLRVAAGHADPSSYDLVVNCTGPAPVSSPGWNPLVDRLAVKGMLWPGPLGLGVDLDTDGALLDASGVASRGIYAMGVARRGVDWEVAAVPDIRRQAVRLAEHLAAHYVPAAPPAQALELPPWQQVG